MKKATLLLMILCFIQFGLYSQVFNTGKTLKKRSLSLGLEPVVFIGGPSNGLNFFIHGGYGIKSGIDFSMKFGVGAPNYFGADLEWRLLSKVSLTTGAHYFGEYGLDGTLNIAIPIKSDVTLYTGVDTDIVLGNDIDIPIWIPLGVEIALRRKVAFILESEIGLTPSAYHVIGGGVVFYF